MAFSAFRFRRLSSVWRCGGALGLMALAVVGSGCGKAGASNAGASGGAAPAAIAVAANPAHGAPAGHGGAAAHGAPGAHGESSPPAHAGAPGLAPSGHEQVAMAAATPSGHAAPPAAHSSETPGPVQSPEGHGPAAPAPQPEGAKPQTPAGHGEMANTPVGANPANPNAAPAAGEGAPPAAEGAGPAGNIPQAPTFPIGTAEYAVQKVCLAAASGQYTGLDGVVSAKADGVLAQIRDGAVSEDEINSFKKRFGEVRLLSVKPRGSTKIVTLQNTGGEALVFTLAKEDEIFRVKDLEIKTTFGPQEKALIRASPVGEGSDELTSRKAASAVFPSGCGRGVCSPL